MPETIQPRPDSTKPRGILSGRRSPEIKAARRRKSMGNFLITLGGVLLLTSATNLIGMDLSNRAERELSEIGVDGDLSIVDLSRINPEAFDEPVEVWREIVDGRVQERIVFGFQPNVPNAEPVALALPLDEVSFNLKDDQVNPTVRFTLDHFTPAISKHVYTPDDFSPLIMKTEFTLSKQQAKDLHIVL